MGTLSGRTRDERAWSPRARPPAVLVAFVAMLVLALSLGARARSAPVLPAVAPDELVASVIAAVGDDPTISGEVTATIDLGLPAPPAGMGGEEASGDALGSLAGLAGDTQLRLWRSADGLRVAELLPTSERALIVGEGDAWAWDSQTMTATRLGPVPHGEHAGHRVDGDPLDVAREFLEAIAPTTAVSVADNAEVAGRAAYTLLLTPTLPDTLVGRVELGIDAEQRLPLRVAVYPRGTETPPVSIAYTSVSYDPVDPATFTFKPPPGATVVEAPPAGHEEHESHGAPRSFGESWEKVVAVPLAEPEPDQRSTGMDPKPDPAAAWRAMLPLSGQLLSARLAQDADGREWLLYGAVPPARLDAVAAQL